MSLSSSIANEAAALNFIETKLVEKRTTTTTNTNKIE
jgi:hypothetical protein